mgnify:CR=1 FL=1
MAVATAERTALGAALLADDDASALLLLSARALPSAPHALPHTARRTAGIPPLVLAAANGRLPTVAALLAARADPDARDPGDLRTPLHAAAIAAAPAVVAALVRAGARADVLMARGALPQSMYVLSLQ